MKIDVGKVPHPVLAVLAQLERHGYQGYLVGGACRDLILERPVHDYDIATNASLEALQTLFPNCKVVGASFGVVLVKVDGMEIQIARFRTEKGYSDYRHPDVVDFTDDIEGDLQRRDLTINAIAMDRRGDLISVTGALHDLENGMIRAVGEPDERFNEDALRMLRCYRFAAQLNFTVDQATENAIWRSAKLIKKIAAERIQEELNKILLSGYPQAGIDGLLRGELLEFILPELCRCKGCEQNGYHTHDVYDHSVAVMMHAPQDLVVRLAALLHDIGKPACKSIDKEGQIHFYAHEAVSASMAKKVLARLKYDNQTLDAVTYLVEHHMELFNFPSTDNGIRRLLNRHGASRLDQLLELHHADLLGTGTRQPAFVTDVINGYRLRIGKVLQAKPAVTFEELAIDGNDIMQILGLKPGKTVGAVKKALMEKVLENPEYNTKEQLREFVRRWEKVKCGDHGVR